MFMDHSGKYPGSRDVDISFLPVCTWKNMLDVDRFTLLHLLADLSCGLREALIAD